MDNFKFHEYDLDRAYTKGISREDIKRKFKNDSRLNSILNAFDKMDANKDRVLNRTDDDYFEHMDDMNASDFLLGLTDKYVRVGRNFDYWDEELTSPYDGKKGTFATPDMDHDGYVTESELKQFFNYKKRDIFTNNDVEFDDYKKLIGYMAEEGEKQRIEETKIFEKKLQIISQKQNISIELLKKINFDPDRHKLQIKNIDGKQTYICEENSSDENSTTKYRRVYNENGKLLNFSIIDNKLVETHYFDEAGNKTGEGMDYYIGDGKNKKLLKSELWDNSGHHVIKGNTKIEYQNFKTDEFNADWGQAFDVEKPKNIEINDGNGNPLGNVEFEYDENGGFKGINITTTNPPAKTEFIKKDGMLIPVTVSGKTQINVPQIDNDTLQTLKELMDHNSTYGKDFELAINDGKVRIVPHVHTGVEKVEIEDAGDLNAADDIRAREMRDNDAPPLAGKAYESYMQMVKSGAHFDEDFSCDYRDGMFIIKKKNNQATGYTAEYQKEYYNKNGELIKKVSVKNGQIDIDATNSEITPEEIEQFKKEAEPYLIEHEGHQKIKTDLTQTPSKDLLPQIQRETVSDSKFRETNNGKTYDVEYTNGKVEITPDGSEKLSIDVSKIPENFVKNVLLKVNAKALYDIAKKGTQLVINDRLNGDRPNSFAHLNGLFMVDENKIYIEPNMTAGERTIQTLTHEMGHAFDNISGQDKMKTEDHTKFNEVYEEEMKYFMEHKEEIFPKKTVQTEIEINGQKHTFDSQISENDFDGELENWMVDASPQEIFAECYSILTSGDSYRAPVLAKYFPKTLAVTKEMIDSQ